MDWNTKKVLVTGGNGFVGTNLCNKLDKLSVNYFAPSSKEYDLTSEKDVNDLFTKYQPNIVLHLAGKVGGIGANKDKPGDFFYDNIMMGTLIMEYSKRFNVEKVVALAAGCGYPKYLEVPYTEDDFWKDLPDENSIGYSMAKKNLIIQSWTYREQFGFDSTILLPANLYGPHDNFNLETSHVVPALIRKFIAAKNNNEKSITVWGTGVASREFLYVDDTVDAIIDAVDCVESGPFNLGTGKETTIKELVESISELTNFKGKTIWDITKPDGQPKRFYDMSKFKEAFGYVPSTDLNKGLKETIEWYLNNIDKIK
ncbi:MAG: GDP-fucose synthetase [Candidatus Pelagibacter sp. TMED64]|nr:MAG: GDP-fucose synthetase [Candidatus Pelagibacter sp. TMED64]